jgi:NADH dehydrogenase [ubiquinone] 1 alpha subcomplex assembly factor 7
VSGAPNAVETALRQRIAAMGAVTVAEYMELALTHYYGDRDPLGARGDFTTAPEISQMFGEMIGLWCVDLWTRMGRPAPFVLAELGPGRGTLMSDLLRAARVAPDFLAAAQVNLVEINAALIATQKAALQGRQIQWHRGFETLPPGPLLLIANEFWDALPVRQLVMTETGWRERTVIIENGAFAFGKTAAGPDLDLLRPAHRAARPGDIAEVSPAGLRLASALGQRLARAQGAALIIDYGPRDSGLGDSLQALKGHHRHDPLQEPGSADLTTHVDFAALADAARDAGASPHGPITQGAFLRELGIELRAATLKAKADAVTRAEVDSALRRLISADGMGSLFKVLALTAPDVPQPAGF